MGFTPGIKAFGAAVLGGIGNVPGAMVGGFFLGLVESVGPSLFFDGIGIPAPYQLRDLIAFTLLIMVLIFRPERLVGRAAGEGARMSVTDPAIATILHDSEAEATPSALRHAVLTGLLFGGIGIYLAVVGLLLMLHERSIIVGVHESGPGDAAGHRPWRRAAGRARHRQAGGAAAAWRGLRRHRGRAGRRCCRS